MNLIKNKYITNISYSLFSNIFSFLISIILVLIIPKALGVKEYAYWQLYLLYISYVGFFHFGLIDGIYLRLGGKEYNELNKNNLSTQFWYLLTFEILLSCIIYLSSKYYFDDIDKRNVLIFTCICGMITIEKTFIIFILQATNRIKEYALLTLMEKIIYSILVIVLLFILDKSYQILILSDIIAKFIILILSIQICKDIIFTELLPLKVAVKEIWVNISIGIKLMIANIASILIIGVVRFAIEDNWDIETFGKVSFAMSISNLLMVLINAISVIMFPMLRRLEKDRLSEVYKIMRTLIMITLLLMLILYYPMRTLLNIWIPQYSESLKYMAIIFPICIYESKVSLLTNTYLKTLRKETILLKINLISVLLSVIMTIITIYWLDNLMLSILMIVIILAFRAILAEILLSRYLKVSFIKNIILEVILTALFIFGNLFLNWIISILIYLFVYIIYLNLNKKNIQLLKNKILKIIKVNDKQTII